MKTNTHWPLYQVISAGDFRRKAAAPIADIVPVSLPEEERTTEVAKKWALLMPPMQ